MKDTKALIIKYWQQMKSVHPSYEEVAQKVGVTKQYVFKVIKDYLKTKI